MIFYVYLSEGCTRGEFQHVPVETHTEAGAEIFPLSKRIYTKKDSLL